MFFLNMSTLARAVERRGDVNTWDLLKKASTQRYCPPSKTSKQLEDIHNFKKESNESLYQAWEWYNDLLYKFPTQDINSHQKVNIFYKCLNSMNCQLLDSQGLILGMIGTQALTAIQTMADYSQKWHDETSCRNMSNSSDTDGLVVVISKLDNLGRDMKKLQENVHAIQVGYQICEGTHLDKECPLNEEVKQVDEVKYGEFGNPAPFNERSGAKFYVGPVGYYTRIDNQTPSGEMRPNLVETINKYMEGAAKRQAKQDEWLKTFCQNTKKGRTNHDKIIQKLKSQVKTLAAEVETKVAKVKECKTIFANDEKPLYTPFYYSPKELEYFYANSGKSGKTDNYPKYMKDLVANKQLTKEDGEVSMNPICSALLQNQLLLKENDLEGFILPCSLGRLDFKNALADLGASISIIPFSIFKRLGIGKLEPINMVLEMADNTKCIPKGIVKNLLIKIDKFILPIDFVILDIIKDFRMPVILGIPLLSTARAKVDIFRKNISLKVGNETVIFKMRSNFSDNINETVRMIKTKIYVEEDELMKINSDLFTYNTKSCEINHLISIDPDVFTYDIEV
nr:hypothetical protein [Tanacetum cinerariifolium]